MKIKNVKLIIVLILGGGLFAACASPQKFDIDREKLVVEENEGLVIGRMENHGPGGTRTWWPAWQKVIGMYIKIGFLHKGVRSGYGIDNDGYFALRIPAGKLEDLTFFYESHASTSNSSGSGNVSVRSSSSSTIIKNIPLATPENPIEVKAGEITIIPMYIFKQFQTQVTTDTEGLRTKEIIEGFRRNYPGLAERYALPEPSEPNSK